jgi:hypothetical protein
MRHEGFGIEFGLPFGSIRLVEDAVLLAWGVPKQKS